jgi:hypothetical protein
MREIELPIPKQLRDSDTERAIDGAILSAGLRVALRGSLKKFPGCVHWHIKNGSLAGTLELTWLPSERRAWFSIQNGRKAKWIQAKLEQIAHVLQFAGDRIR